MRDITVEIPVDDPFKYDVFERQIIAEKFMQIFEKDDKGIVLSIDSDWGTGKTTFIKMWNRLTEYDERYKDKYETIYFNAWDNDYMEDPLLSIFTEVKQKQENQKEQENLAPEILDEIFSPVLLVAKRLADVGLKLKSGGAIGIDDIINFKADRTPDDTLEKLNEIGNEVLNRAIHAKKLREEFKSNLEQFQKRHNKKIIFFIDELDRCRPNFAIKLLETIKHLFSVPGVIFVISLDKEQLAHSVATIYGQNMDTVGYLRRFFDLDYKLPAPDIKAYIDIKNRTVINKYKNIGLFNKFLKGFIIEYKFSIRDIDKLYYYLEFILPIIREFNSNVATSEYLLAISYLYAYLVSIKIKNPVLYKIIVNGNYSSDISTYDEMFGLKSINLIEYDNINFRYLELVKLGLIKRYLQLNYIAINNPKSFPTINKNPYNIKWNAEGYEHVFEVANLFTDDGKSVIVSTIEFIDEINFSN